ncbi:MAG: hypothetical protein R3F44_17160 [Candidatus Competibacteraceae bacterium]
MQFRNRAFRFTDVPGRNWRSLQRMKVKTTCTKKSRFSRANFREVYPNAGRSSLPQETDEVIAGKIGPAIATADEFNAHIYTGP